MKYLLLALAIFLLLAQLVSGNWYVRKCANKIGNCRSKCRTGEIPIVPPTGMCSKEKTCCVLNGRELVPLLCHGTGAGDGGGSVTSSSGGSETTDDMNSSSGTGGGSSGGSSTSSSGGSKTTGASQTGTGSTIPGAVTSPASTTGKVGTTPSP